MDTFNSLTAFDSLQDAFSLRDATYDVVTPPSSEHGVATGSIDPTNALLSSSFEKISSTHKDGKKSVWTHPGYEKQTLACTICGTRVTTPSKLRKHLARHIKPHTCHVAGCRRQEGFATASDLSRHCKSVHKMKTSAGNAEWYQCLVPGCELGSKWWSRKDNFKLHVERVHPGFDVEVAMMFGKMRFPAE